MKNFEFLLDERQVRLLFSPIRHKTDIIRILMESMKIMRINCDINKDLVKGRMLLNVSKMSRLFYFTDSKYYSINFPFFVNQGNMSFSSKSVDNIDSRTTSYILGLLSEETNFINSQSIYDFIEAIEIEGNENYSNSYWVLLKELLLFEDGYIRYDYDEKQNNGSIHPLHHLDIFYSSSSTFKIGLENRISNDSLIDLLDLKTDCFFLKYKSN